MVVQMLKTIKNIAHRIRGRTPFEVQDLEGWKGQDF